MTQPKFKIGDMVKIRYSGSPLYGETARICQVNVGAYVQESPFFETIVRDTFVASDSKGRAHCGYGDEFEKLSELLQ